MIEMRRLKNIVIFIQTICIYIYIYTYIYYYLYICISPRIYIYIIFVLYINHIIYYILPYLDMANLFISILFSVLGKLSTALCVSKIQKNNNQTLPLHNHLSID